MTKRQLRAVNDFCRENCLSKNELLEILKENGTIASNAELDDLSDYVKDDTRKAMWQFLEENV